MAENVGKISYLVEIDTKNFSASLKEVDSAVKGASDSTGKSLDGLASKANIAVAATVAAFGAMAGAAVKSYANYEQLAGGVQKLFGKEQAQTIITNANNAFKTAGLSANDYMETATSFSASLIKGLGGDTAEAARLTDVAIRAMSDNANTFGTDMSSIQYAFQGFAKQNYTMLDNLKLGYGGSAGEMAKLINDSGVLGDAMQVTAETVNNVSFDKIIEAIQKIQEKQNIAGTTSKEAATTISGSWNSLTSAFNNVLTGVDGSGQQLSDSVLNMVRQLAQKVPPIVSNMVTGMGTAIKTSLDAQFGKGTSDIISTIVVIIGTLVGTFVLLYNTIKVATAVQAAFNLVLSANPIGLVVVAIAALVAGLVWFFTQTETGKQIIEAFSNWINTVFIPTIQAIGAWFVSVWDGIVAVWSGVAAWFGGVVNGIKNFFAGIPGAIGGFFRQAWDTVTGIWSGIGSWFGGLGDDMLDAGKNIIDGLVKGISNGKDAVVNKIKEIASEALDAIKSFFGIKSPSRVMAQMGQYMMSGWSIGMDNSADLAISSAKKASNGILGTFDNLTSPTLGINANGSYGGSVGSRTANINNTYIVNNQADAEIISRKQAYAMGAV